MLIADGHRIRSEVDVDAYLREFKQGLSERGEAGEQEEGDERLAYGEWMREGSGAPYRTNTRCPLGSQRSPVSGSQA